MMRSQNVRDQGSIPVEIFLSVGTHCTVTVTIHAFYERNENYKKRGHLKLG